MLKIHGQEFAWAILVCLRRLRHSKMNLKEKLSLSFSQSHLSRSKVFAMLAMKVADTESDKVRFTKFEQSKFKSLLLLTIGNLRDTNPGGLVWKQDVALHDTIKWLKNAFFAAPSDAERKLIIELARKLKPGSKKSWYS